MGSLTPEEKELIQKLKQDLRRLNIPRDQWAIMIQDELNQRRVDLNKRKKTDARKQDAKRNKGFRGALNRAFDRMKSKLTQLLTKFLMRGQDMDPEDMEKYMKMMQKMGPDGTDFDPSDAENMDLLLDMMGLEDNPNSLNVSNNADLVKLGNNATFLDSKTPKTSEVFFDDEDDE